MGIIAGAVMFGMYFYYKKRNKPRPLGLSTSLILVLYFGMRFCVEFFKEYQVEANVGGLREGQILSIPFFIIGLVGVAISLWGPWKKQNVLQFNTAYQIPETPATPAAPAPSTTSFCFSSKNSSESKASDAANESKSTDSSDSADSRTSNAEA